MMTHSRVVEDEACRCVNWYCTSVGRRIGSLTTVELDGVKFRLSKSTLVVKICL